jgi:prepilin-type N-terminal cleavage/methylation domain-containing protein
MSKVKKRKSGKIGFTLTETLIVLALIAIVAAISIPNMRRGTVNTRLRVTARELVSDLDYTRSVAKAKCGTAKMNITTGGASAATAYNVTDPNGVVVKRKTIEDNITVDFSKVADSNAVTYTQTGGTSKGGEIHVKSTATSRYYIIEVNPVTGLTKLVEK